MTLTQSIAATTKKLSLAVRVNNVPLLPADPTSASGVPGVSGVRITNRIGQLPVCSLEVNRASDWIVYGMVVTVDVGYDGFTKRRFTGTVLDVTKGIGKGTVNCQGNSSPLYNTSIIPDRDFSGQTTASGLANLLSYVGIIGTSISTTRAPDVAEFTMGTVTPTTLKNMTAVQMANYIMELQGCKLYETGDGITVIKVIDQVPAATPFKTYTTNANATARILTSELTEDSKFTRTRVKVTGATPAGGVPLVGTAQVGGVSPLVKPPLPAGSYVDAGIFNSLADLQTKVDSMALFYLGQWHRRPRYLSIDLPGDPELECAMTLGLVIPEQSINGNYFIDGWEDTITIPQDASDEGGGYRTTLTGMRGGDQLGGTLTIAPTAAFTMQVEREVFGTGVTDFVIVSLDASGSSDPDGTLTGVYTWTSNKTTLPSMASSTAKTRSVRIDSASLDGTGTDWTITLSVTDNSGAVSTVTLTVPYPTTSPLVTVPALGLAYNSGFGYTPDGGQNWNDRTGATAVSVALRPADGVHSGQLLAGFSNGRISLSTDGGVSSSVVYTLASGSSINFVTWDWRNSNVAWALSSDMQLLISVNAGVTWTIYDALRTVLGLAGAIAGRRCIGLPAAGGVYVFGGNGTGTPLIAYDTAVGAHAWVQVTMLGDPVTDFPADATMRIIDYCAPGTGTEVMILEFASGGGGSITAIYSTVSAPGTSRTFTRATGLTAGLKNGRYVVGDAPSRGDGFFYAAFEDQNIWQTSNGIAWTSLGAIMPAGVTPNDAIWAAGLLTGLPNFTGLYLIAAENAGSTLGLYKSADWMQTVVPLRPAGGAWATWPASGKGKMVSIGAPGATVAGSGRLARLSSIDSLQTYDGSSHWKTLGDGPGTAGLALLNVGGGKWLYIDDSTDDEGDLVYSGDNGANWSVVIAADHVNNAGVFGIDIGADGTIWAVWGKDSTATNGQNTTPLKVYKSIDQGATFTVSYTDPGFTGSGITNGNTRVWEAYLCIAADKVNPNRIAVLPVGSATNEPDFIYTADGGATWNVRTTAKPWGSAPNDTDSFQFVNGSRLLFFFGSTRVMYYSDDLGATWTTEAAIGASGGCNGMARYRATHFNTVIAVQRDTSVVPHLYISRDNGVTWALLTGDPTSTFGAHQWNSIEYDVATDIAYMTSHSINQTFQITPVFGGGTPTVTDITKDELAHPATNRWNALAVPS